MKYLKYFLINFHEEAAYKADFIFYIGSEVVFFVVFYFIWTNVYAKGGATDISSFSLSATITYYFLTSILFRVNPTEAIYLNRAIWNGELTNEIPKPYSLKLIYLVSSYSIAAMEMLTYLPFAGLIFIFVYKYIIFISFTHLLYFFIAMVLASIMGICLQLFLHSLCFHFGDQDANLSLISYIIAFLGGAVFPLQFLPDGLYQALNFLPFKFLFNFPASVYLGKISTHGIWFGFLQMIIWTVVFFCIYYFSFQTGLKKYTAIGR